MACLRIHIRLDRLRAHLASEDREPKSEQDVLAWLTDARFVRAADGPWWLVEELDLGQLRPDEVLAVEDAVTLLPSATPAAPAATAKPVAAGDAVEAA